MNTNNPMSPEHRNRAADRHEPLHLRNLRRIGDWAFALSIVVGVLGVLGGIGIAAQTNDNGYYASTHPYIGVGVAAAFSSVITAVFMLLATLWVQAWNAETQRQWDERFLSDRVTLSGSSAPTTAG